MYKQLVTSDQEKKWKKQNKQLAEDVNHSGFIDRQHVQMEQKERIQLPVYYSPMDVHALSLAQQVELEEYIRSYGEQNVLGAQICVNDKINLRLAHQLVTSRLDAEVVEYLTYGWPVNHDGRPATIMLRNHQSALEYSEAVM